MMRRRDFITFLGGVAAWPLAVRAQQAAVPIIGFLSGATRDTETASLDRFRRGLREAGYTEGANVAIEYRFADGHYDRLPELATDLVRRRVAVIVTGGAGIPTTLAVKAATSTIPIVFAVGGDPVQFGFVASLNRPGGNLTGVASFVAELRAKGLGLLHELIPNSKTIFFLTNPNNPNAVGQTSDLQSAAQAIGQELFALKASTENQIDAAFEIMAQQGAISLVLTADGFLRTRRDQIVSLAARHAIGAVYPFREFADAGGLMSYSPELSGHQQGVYAGRILKGERPADLPVIQPTKFELVINLKTAKALGLAVPPTLLAIADEVIE
jgi:putative ABC transport system substrate-binding protein